MILTIELPGGQLAQGEVLLRIGGWATINAGGLVCGGNIVPRMGQGLQAQVRIAACPTLQKLTRPLGGENSGDTHD